MPRIKVLATVKHYLPGYRFGGPIRSLANMVDQLGRDFEFLIVTSDRDAGDALPYQDVPIGSWTDVGLAKVFYVPASSRKVGYLRRLIQATEYDILYLNSCFTPFETIWPLALQRIRALPRVPTIVAPRGELSDGAMAIKSAKKQLYLLVANTLGLYTHVTWQASSDLEAAEIRARLPSIKCDVRVAPNLLATRQSPQAMRDKPTERDGGILRLVFASRIGPKKNLDFLLRALAGVARPAELSIVGPVDDERYWRHCQSLIRLLPDQVKVCLVGAVPHEELAAVFARHDLFAFPTRNENFGHVVIEALSAGTPVLISPNSPWPADADGAITVLPLVEDYWAREIERLADLPRAHFQTIRRVASQYAERYLADDSCLAANRDLFRFVINARKPSTAAPRGAG